MSSQSKPEDVLDPVSTLGPFPETGVVGDDQNEDEGTNETTRLLPDLQTRVQSQPPSQSQVGVVPRSHTPPNQGNVEPQEHTHYRDIDGRRFWWLFASIIAAYTLAFFDSTFMASSHPVITSYFNASNSASWLSTVFYLSSTIFQPLYGRVSDVTGRKSMFLLAISIFGVTTAWCALAQSIGSFIAARAFCGLGAGGVIAMANILMSDVVKIEYRGLYQSYLNMAYGTGNGLGAALGGLLCDKLGWRYAFGVQLPFIVAFLILASIATPAHLGPSLAKSQGKSLAEALKTFDSAGAVMLTVTVTSLILGINLGGNVLSWSHPVVISALVLFVVSAVALVSVEKRPVRPVLPLPLLSTIPNANLNWSNLLSAVVTNTVLFNVPLFLQAVKQVTPTTSGLVLISPLVGVTLSSILSGLFITWTRRVKPVMILGVLSLLCGIVAVSRLHAQLPTWAILLLIPFASIGQGFFFPATTVSILAINPQDEQAVVSTTLGLSRNIGAIVGVAVSSWVLQNALVVYLHREVTGSESEKGQIISDVRKSIRAIAKLGPMHQKEVIAAYSNSLRATFLSGVIFAVVVCCMVLPVHIPDLPRSQQARSAVNQLGREDARAAEA